MTYSYIVHTESDDDLTIFNQISDALLKKGVCVLEQAVPQNIVESLASHIETIQSSQFDLAGIGRTTEFEHNKNIRSDKICWISGNSDAGKQWLNWATALKNHLNRTLFLGLFSFESHFAHYAKGAFYQRHLDAFNGDKNRLLSLVLYLNKNWQPKDGGELVLYQNEQDSLGIKITPSLGTLVLFLSEEFPHEVLSAKKDRFSIAGWFRVNCSHEHKVDPPQ